MKLSFDTSKSFLIKEFSFPIKEDENLFISRLNELTEKKVFVGVGEMNKQYFLFHNYYSGFGTTFNTINHIFECVGKIENNYVKYKIRFRGKYKSFFVAYFIIAALAIIDSLIKLEFSGIFILFIVSVMYYLMFFLGYKKFKEILEYEFNYCSTGKYSIDHNKGVPY